ncbi:MAG TPA: hypothetical protein VGE67_07565 [Haloferula sp.]
MNSKLLSLFLCPLALSAQETQQKPVPVESDEVHIVSIAPVNIWEKGTVTLTTTGTTTLAELIELLKEQLGDLNWIMQDDVGDIKLPAFSVRDASVQSLMMLLGTAAGFDVQSAPPQAANQREIVMIRRSVVLPFIPPTSATKIPRPIPLETNPPEPGKKTKTIPADPNVESIPLPSKNSAKTLKVMSLGAFSDDASWNRHTRGLDLLLTSVLGQGGDGKGLPEGAITFNSDSRLLIIRMEPEKAAEAAQLVEGYVSSLKERQAAVDEQLKDLLKKKMAAEMDLRSTESSGKGENNPLIEQLKSQLDALSKAIYDIEMKNGLR